MQGGGEEGGGGQEKPKREKRLKNQFNFSERASQTFNNPARVCSNNYVHGCGDLLLKLIVTHGQTFLQHCP